MRPASGWLKSPSWWYQAEEVEAPDPQAQGTSQNAPKSIAPKFESNLIHCVPPRPS